MLSDGELTRVSPSCTALEYGSQNCFVCSFIYEVLMERYSDYVASSKLFQEKSGKLHWVDCEGNAELEAAWFEQQALGLAGRNERSDKLQDSQIKVIEKHSQQMADVKKLHKAHLRVEHEKRFMESAGWDEELLDSFFKELGNEMNWRQHFLLDAYFQLEDIGKQDLNARKESRRYSSGIHAKAVRSFLANSKKISHDHVYDSLADNIKELCLDIHDLVQESRLYSLEKFIEMASLSDEEVAAIKAKNVWRYESLQRDASAKVQNFVHDKQISAGKIRVNMLLNQAEMAAAERERGMQQSDAALASVVKAFALNWLSKQKLSAQQREIIDLKLQGASIKDIASALGKAESNIHVQLDRASKKVEAQANDSTWFAERRAKRLARAKAAEMLREEAELIEEDQELKEMLNAAL